MRIPILFYTYLAAEICAPLFAGFIILSSVLFLGRLIPFLDFILDFSIGFKDFIRLCAYLLPQLFFFSIPVASMMGVIISFTRLTNDREIMAFKASGIGLRRMMAPVVVIALFTAGLTGFFSISLGPAAHVAMKKLLFQLAKEKIDKGLREKRFSAGTGDVVLYVDRIDQQSREWQGVYVSDMRDRQVPVTIMARRGNFSEHVEDMTLVLALTDGSLHRSIGDTDQTIRFDRYTLDLPLPSQQKIATTVNQGDKRDMTQQQLRQQVESSGIDTERGRELLLELHDRLVLPVGCFLLTLVGFPLGLLAAPGRRAIGIPLGLGLFILYYVLNTAGKAMGESLVLPVAPAMWLPNVIFGLLTFYLIHRTTRETIAVHSGWIVGIGRRFARLWRRKKDS